MEQKSQQRELANIDCRLDLACQVANIIKAKGLTQGQAAERCGISRPRFNDLIRGRLERFSLDALVNIASKLGYTIRITLY